MTEEFTLDWKKRLNWITDPFNTKVLDLVGYEKAKKKLNLFFLEKKTFGIIEGEKGAGKSSLIDWLKKQLRKFKSELTILELEKEKKVEEVIEKISKELANPIDLIKKRYKGLNYEQFTQYIKNKSVKKRLVFLIDGPSKLSLQIIGMMKALYKEGLITIIISGTKEELQKTPAHFAKDQLNVNLKGLEYEGAKLMVKRRIEASGGIDIKPFNDKNLKNLWQQSNKNAIIFLDKCRDKAIKLALEQKEVIINKPQKIKELTTIDLKKFAKENLKEGFLRDDIEQLLKEEGYSRSKVTQILDDVEEDIVKEKLESEDKKLEETLS